MQETYGEAMNTDSSRPFDSIKSTVPIRLQAVHICRKHRSLQITNSSVIFPPHSPGHIFSSPTFEKVSCKQKTSAFCMVCENGSSFDFAS